MNAVALFPPRQPSPAEVQRAMEIEAELLRSPEALADQIDRLNCLRFNAKRNEFGGAGTLLALAIGDDTALLVAAKRIQQQLRARMRELAEDRAEEEFDA